MTNDERAALEKIFCSAMVDVIEKTIAAIEPAIRADERAKAEAEVARLRAALKAVNRARHTDEPYDWQRATDLTDAALAMEDKP